MPYTALQVFNVIPHTVLQVCSKSWSVITVVVVTGVCKVKYMLMPTVVIAIFSHKKASPKPCICGDFGQVLNE